MRTTIKRLAAALLLCFLAVSPLVAQTNTPVEAEPASRSLADIERQKLQLDKDLATDKLNADKDAVEKKYDAQREMVHDIAWNSWVIFVIAIFFFGYLKDKRRHETIRLMIEKGTPITPELLDGLRKKSRLIVRTSYDSHGYLCWGITLTLVGIAMIVFSVWGKAGWIVLAIGVADLILWFIDKANSNDSQAK
jgi:hypothetical protein